MAEIVLLLGPVVFRDFEVPGEIRFGGRQRMSVHRLYGGGRMIDVLGRDDADIWFSGIFSGQDATLRARLLDELRCTGMALPLTWDVFFYSVVIREFRADYRNGWWIPYGVRCTVLRDESGALAEAAVSLASSVVADVAAAGAQISQTDFDFGIGEISGAIASLGAGGAGGDIFAARSAVSTQVGSIEGSWQPSAVDSAGTASDGVAAVAAAADATRNLALLATASGYLGRAATNAVAAGSQA